MYLQDVATGVHMCMRKEDSFSVDIFTVLIRISIRSKISISIGRRERINLKNQLNAQSYVYFNELAFSEIFYQIVFGQLLTYWISNIFNNQQKGECSVLLCVFSSFAVPFILDFLPPVTAVLRRISHKTRYGAKSCKVNLSRACPWMISAVIWEGVIGALFSCVFHFMWEVFNCKSHRWVWMRPDMP